MAKKTSSIRAQAATASTGFVTCNGYKLTMDNSPTSFIFQLDAVDANGNPFLLRVNNFNENVGTVQKVMRIIADRWPAFAFEFKADSDGNIIDAQ